MELKEFDIMLDIKKSKKIEDIEVVQKDYESNILNISIVEGFEPYNLSGLSVEIAFAKPDGTTVLQDEENGVIIEDPAEGKIRCILNTNTIAASGKVFAEVRILQDLRLLTTARFDFFVRRAIVNDETIESTNEFPILNKLINDTKNIVEAVPVIEGKLDEITNTESELNQSILEGNTLKGDLDSSIQEGNTLKVGLDNSIVEGNVIKGELDDIIKNTDFEQVLIELNNKADKAELGSLAGEGRTTETVKDNADRISILNTKVSPETPLTTTSQNLSGAVNEVKDELVAHKAETVSYYTYATRNLTLEGQQIISGFPFIPKALIIETMVPSSNKISFGRIAQNGGYGIATNETTDHYTVFSEPIVIVNSGSDQTRASVTINQDKTLTLNWVKTGTGATGTAQIRILALSHGGV